MAHGDKIVTRSVDIPARGVRLAGDWSLPESASGIVVFAHGSGSGRLSPRNRFVAQALNNARLGTLLVDLLTEDEEQDRRLVFDIELLTERLRNASAWVREQEGVEGMRIGYFGASTGAAAALCAASKEGPGIGAVVSRGGRPDLGANCLARVVAPTLLLVGGNDIPVIDLNQQAYDLLNCTKEVVVIPGATHLFPEPGALEEVARLAKDWFLRYLSEPIERAVSS